MPYGRRKQAKTSDKYLTVQWNGVTVDDATQANPGQQPASIASFALSFIVLGVLAAIGLSLLRYLAP